MSTKFLIITEEVLLDHSVNQSTLDTDLNLLDNGKRGPGLIEINILVTHSVSQKLKIHFANNSIDQLRYLTCRDSS